MEKIVRTCCQSSHSECGVLVQVQNGEVTGITGDPDHPISRGYICVKGKAQPRVIYHPDRLKHPLKQAGERGSEEWHRISWEEALDEIATKIDRVKGAYAPESFASIHGTGPRSSSAATTLLAHALGSPNVISTDLHICFAPSTISAVCTFGQNLAMELGPDYRSANCVLVWAANPVNSHGPKGRDILEAKRRGAKLIVVDPRGTVLAKQADIWLRVRPGTDAALALGMIHLLIEEGIYDKAFVEKWCYGFEKLRDHVKPYTPARVGEITWIPPEKIIAAARMYATTKPAAAHSRVGLEQNINSAQTVRAFNILVALAGNIDVQGGNLLSQQVSGYIRGHDLYAGADPRFRLSPEVEEKRIGSKQYPLTSSGSAPIRAFTFVQAPLAIDAMLSGKPYPIKALYSAGGSPMITQQNVRRVRDALKRLDLLVVADFFMTPTAKLADYVLPVAHWLERDECCDGMYHNTISARQRVVDPPPECWDDMKIAVELAKRLPWDDRRFLPWNDIDAFNEMRMKDTGLSFVELKKRGYVTVPRKYKKYEEAGFKTPTRKVEICSTVFEQLGYDPLPSFVEPAESPVSTPDLAKQYPLILITGGRNIVYFNSEGRQIPQLRKLSPDPQIEIHPTTAREMGIDAGSWVWVETPKVKGERVKLRAKLTPDIDPRVVHAEHGWWFPEDAGPEHGCFNSSISVVLSDESPKDPICGSVPLRGTLCRIYSE